MSHCKCCHFNDTSYHTESSNNLSHVNNGAHYNCNSNTSGTTFQYDQDVLQTSPPISQTEWGSSEYYRQEGVHFNPAPSNVYKPMVYNTPPEEMLHALLREQSDDYYYSPYKNSATGTPLSPMSMQSIDSFDTVQSPKFEGLISSPNIRASYISSTQTTQKNSLYYVGNPSAVQDIYFHQQDFKRHHNTEHQDQYQLQLQYEFEQQQNLLHNTLDNPQYNTLPSHQHQYNQQQQQQQLSRNNNDRRRYNNTQHLTTHQHNNCSTNIKACSENSKHPLENNEKVQHKRKRNSSRRTSPSQLICPTCSRKFTRPYNLKSHQRTHTKERPYVCVRPGCTWTFARPHDLKRHDLLHSGIKKYVCSCGKPFARSDAFKRHQAVDKVCSLRLKGNYI